MVSELRLCTVCSERKEEDCFAPSYKRSTKKGLTGTCKSCTSNSAKVSDRLSKEELLKNRESKSADLRWCTMCETLKVEHLFSRIAKHTKTGRCKSCVTKRRKQYYEENKEKAKACQRKCGPKYYIKNKSPYERKGKTQAKTKWAFKKGLIKKEPCKVCLLSKGIINEDSIKHHHDYSKHLSVWWLCRSHHRLVHESIKRKIEEGRINPL